MPQTLEAEAVRRVRRALAPDMDTARLSDDAARQLLRDGGWGEDEIASEDIRDIQQGLESAMGIVKAASGDFAVEDSRRQRIAHKTFLQNVKFSPPPRLETANPQVVSTVLQTGINRLEAYSQQTHKCVETNAALTNEIVLLTKYDYFRFSVGGVDDEHTAPVPALENASDALALFLDVQLGNWPSLAHVIAELWGGEGAREMRPGTRAAKVERFNALMEAVVALLRKARGLDKAIVTFAESLARVGFYCKALELLLVRFDAKDWRVLWFSPISRGFYVMLIVYCSERLAMVGHSHTLDFDAPCYRMNTPWLDSTKPAHGWNVSAPVKLTTAWFLRLVDAKFVQLKANPDRPLVAGAAFSLDDPAWAEEVRAARSVRLVYRPTQTVLGFNLHEHGFEVEVHANGLPLLACLPKHEAARAVEACKQLFAFDEWHTLACTARLHAVKQPIRAAHGAELLGSDTTLLRAHDTGLRFCAAQFEAVDSREFPKFARDFVLRARRAEREGQPPTPWKRHCAMRIQRAFRRHRRRRLRAAAQQTARKAARKAARKTAQERPKEEPSLAEDTDKLLNAIVIGVDEIASEGPHVHGWWWKRPRTSVLSPISINLPSMPVLKLVQNAAEKLLAAREQKWTLGIIASTGAAILPKLIEGVQLQLTKLHEKEVGAPASHRERSVAMWHTLTERRMRSVFYVHFVHPIRRMRWATERILVAWRKRALRRAVGSHLYALTVHQHSFLVQNFKHHDALGKSCARAEMENVIKQALSTHPCLNEVLMHLFVGGPGFEPPDPTDTNAVALSYTIHALLRGRELQDSIRSPAYIREQLELARKRWAQYPDRDDGGSRWRSDCWRWNADCKWKPTPEPRVCWACGKQECKGSAERRAWDDRWDGAHAVRVALRLGRGGNPGVLAALRPVPVLKLRAVDREGDVFLRPYAGAHLTEPFLFKMRLCPCPRCNLREGAENGEGAARYHDAACQAADWPRHKRGAGPAGAGPAGAGA
jgi:hypothetical protein